MSPPNLPDSLVNASSMATQAIELPFQNGLWKFRVPGAHAYGRNFRVCVLRPGRTMASFGVEPGPCRALIATMAQKNAVSTNYFRLPNSLTGRFSVLRELG